MSNVTFNVYWACETLNVCWACETLNVYWACETLNVYWACEGRFMYTSLRTYLSREFSPRGPTKLRYL